MKFKERKGPVPRGRDGVLEREGEGNREGVSLTRCVQVSKTLNGTLKVCGIRRISCYLNLKTKSAIK